jgi:hypothetical protein
MSVHAGAEDPWGGLPAPWEPLPEWMTVPRPLMNADGDYINGNTAEAATAGVLTSSYPAANGSPSPAASNGAPSSGAPSSAAWSGAMPQFAESTRSLEPAAGAPAPAAAAAGAVVEPDLDALAHQVYSILKRRLSAERRRLG